MQKKNDISRTTTVISSEIVRPLFEGLQGDHCYVYIWQMYTERIDNVFNV